MAGAAYLWRGVSVVACWLHAPFLWPGLANVPWSEKKQLKMRLTQSIQIILLLFRGDFAFCFCPPVQISPRWSRNQEFARVTLQICTHGNSWRLFWQRETPTELFYLAPNQHYVVKQLRFCTNISCLGAGKEGRKQIIRARSAGRPWTRQKRSEITIPELLEGNTEGNYTPGALRIAIFACLIKINARTLMC